SDRRERRRWLGTGGRSAREVSAVLGGQRHASAVDSRLVHLLPARGVEAADRDGRLVAGGQRADPDIGGQDSSSVGVTAKASEVVRPMTPRSSGSRTIAEWMEPALLPDMGPQSKPTATSR